MGKTQGRAKEALGVMTGNESRKAEGRSDQRKGTAKRKKAQAKDPFN